MKLKKISFMLISALFVMSGCETDGSLEVVNNTEGWLDAYVNDDYTYLDRNEAVEYTWSIAFAEELDVSVEADGLFVLDYSDDMTLIGGDDESIYVDANAAAIRIENNSSDTIWEIYISASSSSSWNEDQLGADILNSDEHVEYTVTPGGWDIKLVDSRDNEYFAYYGVDHDALEAGELYTINFHDKKSGFSPATAKKKSEGMDPDTDNYRIVRRY